jgi:hypothetical protein
MRAPPLDGAGARTRSLLGSSLPGAQRPLRTLAGLLRGFALFGRWDSHARAPRLREAYRDRLLWRTRSVFALSNVVDLLAHEFTGLRARSLPFALAPAGPFDGLLLRQAYASSPPAPTVRGRGSRRMPVMWTSSACRLPAGAQKSAAVRLDPAAMSLLARELHPVSAFTHLLRVRDGRGEKRRRLRCASNPSGPR